MVSPPGTGKTLVAEILAVNEWVSSGKPSVYLVPYVALAEEKYDEFDMGYRLFISGNRYWKQRNLQIGRLQLRSMIR